MCDEHATVHLGLVLFDALLSGSRLVRLLLDHALWLLHHT